MIESLKEVKMLNWIRVKHLDKQPLDDFTEEIKEHIIVDHDMNMICFRLNEGNHKSMATAMCEMAKLLVKDGERK